MWMSNMITVPSFCKKEYRFCLRIHPKRWPSEFIKLNTKSTLKPLHWFWNSWLVGSPFIWVFLWIPARADLLETDTPKIRAIGIERQDIFSAEQESHWLFRLANQLHLRTKETVVRRELLFRPGEKYDSALTEETERNLRGLGIF